MLFFAALTYGAKATTMLNNAINLGDAVAREDIAALEEINQEEVFFFLRKKHA